MKLDPKLFNEYANTMQDMRARKLMGKRVVEKSQSFDNAVAKRKERDIVEDILYVIQKGK
jgi:hypothetical protein